MFTITTSDGIVFEIAPEAVLFQRCGFIQEQAQHSNDIYLPLIDSATFEHVIAYENGGNYAQTVFYINDGLKSWVKLIIAADYLGYESLQKDLSRTFAHETMDKTVKQFESMLGRTFSEEEREFIELNVRWSGGKGSKMTKDGNMVCLLTGHSPHAAFRFIDGFCHGTRLLDWGANRAARHGRLEVVRGLRARGIHCADYAADWAAESGRFEIVRDLRAHGFHCTQNGANGAAGNGHLEIVRDLRARGIQCTEFGADLAAGGNHLEVVRDLRAHGIHCTEKGAIWATVSECWDVIKDLRDHGIHYPVR